MENAAMAKPSRTVEGLTELILEIFRVNGLLLAAGDRLSKNLGLTSARWQVMGALADGPLTASQVARRMGLTRQSVQRLVDLLTEEGLIALDENPDHRRAKLIRLTDEGQRRLARMSEIQAGWADRIGKGLSVERVSDATSLLQDLRDRLLAGPDDRGEP
jgi:DNA-binding MarR family transcriptional regulator